MSDRVEWEINDGIGILTISNPPENYLFEPEFVPLAQLRQWTGDSALKGILIRGKGKHFSAGGDLRQLFTLVSEDDNLDEKLAAGHGIINHLHQTNLPLVAAIHGVCFGGGLEIALACDIRVAAENALFAAPETSHGLIPGMGGTIRIPATVGIPNALQMILTGEILTAEEAVNIHLVDMIVPRKELFSSAFNLLHRMVKNGSPRIIRAVVETLRNASTMPAGQAACEETKIFCELAKEEYARRLSESK
ncbi:MAG: enoyl-CoA hydratase/isomerase family protein [Bacteroidales bacterium]|nr:enoyl-CoA hydratase/isomerase family protein [Bacteroidales bacterium]